MKRAFSWLFWKHIDGWIINVKFHLRNILAEKLPINLLYLSNVCLHIFIPRGCLLCSSQNRFILGLILWSRSTSIHSE